MITTVKELKQVEDYFNNFKCDINRQDNYIEIKSHKNDYIENDTQILKTENTLTVSYSFDMYDVELKTYKRYYENDNKYFNYIGCNGTEHFNFAFENIESVMDFIKSNCKPCKWIIQ